MDVNAPAGGDQVDHHRRGGHRGRPKVPGDLRGGTAPRQAEDDGPSGRDEDFQRVGHGATPTVEGTVGFHRALDSVR